MTAKLPKSTYSVPQALIDQRSIVDGFVTITIYKDMVVDVSQIAELTADGHDFDQEQMKRNMNRVAIASMVMDMLPGDDPEARFGMIGMLSGNQFIPVRSDNMSKM